MRKFICIISSDCYGNIRVEADTEKELQAKVHTTMLKEIPPLMHFTNVKAIYYIQEDDRIEEMRKSLKEFSQQYKFENRHDCDFFGESDGTIGTCVECSYYNEELWKRCNEYRKSK